MANTIFISPGVFTREKDQSFLQRGLSAIGGAFIGVIPKGPGFVPTQIANFSEFRQKFGDLDPNYVMPYAVRSYMKNSGVATIVRVMGVGGFVTQGYIPIHITGSQVSSSVTGTILAATLRTTTSGAAAGITGSQIRGEIAGLTGSDITDFDIQLSGSFGNYAYNALSLKSTDPNYIGKIIGTDPTTGPYIYLDEIFSWVINRLTTNSNAVVTRSIAQNAFSGSTAKENDFTFDYQEAETPWIISQNFGTAPATTSYNLFKFHTLADGNAANTEIKIAVQDMKKAPISGEDNYGAFTLVVREYDDNDRRSSVLESFANLNLNPNSKNYVAKRIGDRYYAVDSEGKTTSYGTYDVRSRYVRMEMGDLSGVPEEALPFGFKGYQKYVGFIPQLPYKYDQFWDAEYNSKVYYGIDFTQDGIASRFIVQPDTTPASDSIDFKLDLASGSNSGSYTGSINLTSSVVPLSMKKFALAFYKGFDGWNKEDVVSYNSGDRYDCSSTTASGTVSFRRAVDTIKNPDNIDFNLLCIPGVSSTPVTNYALEMVEDRGDAFYIMDLLDSGSSVVDATEAASSFDTNYAAVYYPWIKIFDPDNEKDVWVPPTVEVVGAISYNDKIAFPWYAPAGLNRATLTNVKEAEIRLLQSERDELYEGRVNPIATFQNQGVVVWGQKTLQVKSSALDRVNVRRLLIYARKLIASSAKYLVFEPNNAKTWDKFIGMVNPILESMQINNGLFAFKVVMDSSTNTPDLIDQNQMYGKIYLQPTRTAEIILLDFNIQRTGASFSE